MIIEGVNFELEVARTDSQIRTGLMGRTSLGNANGMLFIFPTEKMRAFTMDNNNFDLDIWFLDSNGFIVGIQEMDVPKPMQKSPYYIGPSSSRYVIEDLPLNINSIAK